MQPIAAPGQRIRAARERAGISQSELARRLSVVPQAVQKWESDGNGPKRSRMQDLATALNVSVSYLMGEDETTGSESTPSWRDERIQQLSKRLADLPDEKLRAIAIILEIAI